MYFRDFQADQLFLKYGGEVGRCEAGDPVDIDLGIDNSFIASVISKRKTSFLSNTISTVTVDFLINHIEVTHNPVQPIIQRRAASQAVTVYST